MIKKAEAVKVPGLKRLVTVDNKPTGAKTVGGGTVLVYMSGDTNYYLSDSPALRELLWKYKIEP